VLAVLPGVLGLSAVTGYLDFVLFPAPAFFLDLTLYAVWRKQGRDRARETEGS
jgi:mercuric ion transport protein